MPLVVHLPAAMAGSMWTDLTRVAFTADLTPTLYALLGYQPAEYGPLYGSPLFNPPADWLAAFDLVHECYTLQALPDAARAEALRRIARFVRPGGRLLVIARARDGSGPVAGPPWRASMRLPPSACCRQL